MCSYGVHSACRSDPITITIFYMCIGPDIRLQNLHRSRGVLFYEPWRERSAIVKKAKACTSRE